jgi:TonB family protein
MKICPSCGRDYVDELDFCLEDGTRLVATAKITERKTEEFGEATFVRPAPTMPAQTVAATTAAAPVRSSSKLAVFVVVGILLAGMLVLLGAGLAGAWFYLARKSDVVQANVNINGNSAGNANVSNNMVLVNTNTGPIPSPVSNLSPSPTSSPNRTPTPANKDANGDPPSAQPERSPSAPKTISAGVLNGKAISLPKPPYPPVAKAVRASGAVSVQVLIDEKGNVVSATAVSGHPLLQAAAVQAARGAKFSPTVLSGQPVKVSGIITYNFVP